MASLMEREWSCYGGGQFKEGESLLRRWPVSRRENGRYRGGHFNKSHVTEVVSLMEGEWSCYRGGQFNAGRMVMLRRWSV